ncbi:MAG: hypothetical protein KDK51_10405, partial [Deltaproteobacteria bacterium]|nr:hypothetical protein [Deltaproteobacteria bacterium]
DFELTSASSDELKKSALQFYTKKLLGDEASIWTSQNIRTWNESQLDMYLDGLCMVEHYILGNPENIDTCTTE